MEHCSWNPLPPQSNTRSATTIIIHVECWRSQLIYNCLSSISRMLCPLTMWRGFSPGWSLTSRALYASSMGESRLEKSPWKKRKTSRKEVKTERDDLITKQEMESALSVMKSQIVEEIRWAIVCVRISVTCIFVWYQGYLSTYWWDKTT